MNRRYRQTQIITIIALVVVMLGVSVGFAAFSNILTIGSSAQVKPDSSTFSVLFSSSGTTQATSAVSGTGSGGATGGGATISGTTISGLKANFTAPGQSVTYTFYSHNVGSFVAYLRSITFGTGKACIPGTNTSSDMVNAACDDINVSVKIGSGSYSSDSTIYAHSLAIDAYETVTVTISYDTSGDVADGEFSVTFGDVSLTYSSVDGEYTEITFTAYGNEFTAIEGMTWLDFINSSYNVDNTFSYIQGSTIMPDNIVAYYGEGTLYLGYSIPTFVDDEIVADGVYGAYD